MKLLVLTDIHRGFTKNTHRIHAAFAESIKAEGLEFDAVVCSGDIGTARIKHLSGGLKFLRGLAGTRPVIVVLGNHDYWDKGIRSYRAMRAEQLRLLEKFDIHYLEEHGPFVVKDESISIVGYDGWYADPNPRTNDLDNMNFLSDSGWGPHPMLYKKAYLAMQRATEQAERAASMGHKTIMVTHFPIHEESDFGGMSRYYSEITRHADVLIFGHSHRRVDGVLKEGVRLYNAGCDYDNPRYLLLDL